MKLATLILILASAAFGGVTVASHHTRAGEMKRHEQAVLKIEEAEIDAKAAFQKESLRCGTAKGQCLKVARDKYNLVRQEIQAKRADEDTQHQKNMLIVLSSEARKGGCM